MARTNREFSVAGSARYDRRGPLRWLWSHLRRHPLHLAGYLGGNALANTRNAALALLTGAAFDAVVGPDPDRDRLLRLVLVLIAVVLVAHLVDALAAFAAEVLAKRLERDAREELFVALLGKSQTFHNRQRVGDLMARATSDTRWLSAMVMPGMSIVGDSILVVVSVLVGIAIIDAELLLVPVLFIITGLIALRVYTRELQPVAIQMREQYGKTTAGLAEAIDGIEVVKSAAQEIAEEGRFTANARHYRDLFVRNGQIQARYIPMLLLAIAAGIAFLHAVWLYSRDGITIGQLTAFVGLVSALRFPASISIWTVNLVQMGIIAAGRVLGLIVEETELDEHQGGHAAAVGGEIVFERVSFGYGESLVLRDLSFQVAPGQTVAIVGQTGSGKSTLTKLVNRTYDVTAGRILIDGVDVRAWSLDALRSQISTIEQDVFLFSRSIAANIAFGARNADRAAIETAARDAQADAFIRNFKDGYETEIGERGVTLSGGQRQRIAIARALLSDPRILILDDATSAIDSQTEDEIQLAIRRLLRGRTTLLITHRLSMIRWADKVLVLHKGDLIAQGTHDDLLTTCDLYRRIFSRYESALTPYPLGAGRG